jgi:hypothetical protein
LRTHLLIACLLLCVLLSCCGNPALAQSTFNLELGNRGTVTVTLKLRLQTAPAEGLGTAKGSTTLMNTVVLPFQLEDGFSFSKADNIEISVLSNRAGYSILTILATTTSTETTLRIDNAFRLTDERIYGRVKFACDSSYKNLKQHRGILDAATTISKYDITVVLPSVYRREDLSFAPSENNWTADEPGRRYTLAASAADPPKEVWIAFPSPFKGGLQAAEIAVSCFIGVVLLIGERKLVVSRTFNTPTLFLILILTLVADGLAIYYSVTLAEWREFLAWAAAPMVPFVVAPFMCAWLLVRTRYDAEMSGKVTLDGDTPRYVQVSLNSETKEGNYVTRRIPLREDGSYQVFVWCRKSKVKAYISASAAAVEPSKSDEFELEAKKKVPVPIINVKRLQVQVPSLKA